MGTTGGSFLKTYLENKYLEGLKGISRYDSWPSQKLYRCLAKINAEGNPLKKSV
jgi:hypothetical protein